MNSNKLFPEIKTENYLLRKLNMSDVNEIYILRSDEEVNKYTGIDKAKSISDAEKFVLKIENGFQDLGWIYWTICYKSDPKMIGTICYWNFDENNSMADIGFTMMPGYHGKGVMKEVIPAVLKYGFEKLCLESINGEVEKGNLRSIQILKKNGFIKSSSDEITDIYTLKNEMRK